MAFAEYCDTSRLFAQKIVVLAESTGKLSALACGGVQDTLSTTCAILLKWVKAGISQISTKLASSMSGGLQVLSGRTHARRPKPVASLQHTPLQGPSFA